MDGLDEFTLLEIRRRLRALRAVTNAEAVFLILGDLIVERSGDWRCAPRLPFTCTGGLAYDRAGRHTLACPVRIPKQSLRYQLLVVNPETMDDDTVLTRMRGTKEELETLIVDHITHARNARKRKR